MTPPGRVDPAARRAYLATRRWFVGSDGPIEAVEPLPWTRSPDDGFGVRVELVRVVTAAGDDRTYQVPASYRREPFPGLEGALMAVEDGWHVYDALSDAHARSALLAGWWQTSPDGIVHHDLGIALHGDVPTVPMVVEQTNTSTVVDGRLVWKMFRIVQRGPNPDVEVGVALGPHVGPAQGAAPVAALRGWTSHHDRDLSVLHDYLTTASDGWDLARASVRDLVATGLDDPAAAGGDFGGEARRLGMAVAATHRAMTALGGGRADPSSLAARLSQRFAATSSADRWGAEAELAFGELAELDEPVEVQRVHGDLHLGQVLRTVEGWRLFDFEGEPAAPLAQRRALDSPLRDVAAMLRSFDYAPHSVRLQAQTGDLRTAAAWTSHASEAFLTGYGIEPGTAAYVLLRCHQIDKAAYEVDYELAHRPGWADIPRQALERLLGP